MRCVLRAKVSTVAEHETPFLLQRIAPQFESGMRMGLWGRPSALVRSVADSARSPGRPGSSGCWSVGYNPR